MNKNFSDKIKAHAIELGFEKVGISRAEPISKEKQNLEKVIYFHKKKGQKTEETTQKIMKNLKAMILVV